MTTHTLFRKIVIVSISFLFIGTCIEAGIDSDDMLRGQSKPDRTTTTTHICPQPFTTIDPPPMEWNKTFSLGGANEIGYLVEQTSDNGYIIAASSPSWLIKTDENGTLKWSKTWNYPFTLFSLNQTNDGGYILVGELSVTDGGYNYKGLHLIKTDTNGTEQWNRTFGSSQQQMKGYSVQQTSDEGYIVTGKLQTEVGVGRYRFDVLLLKTDTNGTETWMTYFGGIGESAWDYNAGGYAVEQTSDGNYIILGELTYRNPTNPDMWLIKADENGTMLWNRTFGGTDADWVMGYGQSVQQTTDGGYILIGETKSYGNGHYDFWLIKTDLEGHKEWDRTFGGYLAERGYAVQQTRDGGYILTGSHNCCPGDLWVIKTNESGIEEWDKDFGQDGFYDTGYSIQQTRDGGYIVVGYTESYGANGKDIWLIKLAKENHPPTIPIIRGTTNGKIRTEYTYNAVSTDVENETISYFFNWGDNTTSNWTPFAPSGIKVSANHTWMEKDTYTIQVKAKDEQGSESAWGTLEVSMPKSTEASTLFWQIVRIIYQIIRA